ncbi:MAG: hypothetical protein KBS74_08275 [Clostridiales bacterium]|nr:hypothetical protein [Candidatus Cacconaster stercorequi]
MLRYLAATPEQLSAARACTPHIAHMAYRIGADDLLLCAPLPDTLRGGLLMLSDCEAPPVRHSDFLCRQLLCECLRRNYAGIVLDFENAPTDDRIALVQVLDGMVPLYHRQLFVPELWAPYAPHSTILICTALSGGSLHQRFAQAVEQFPPHRLALDGQRLMMDFPLPCPDGQGVPLSIDALRRRARGRSVFFSEDLCARYFTYRIGCDTHFVLFDDADTLQRKTELAASLGIQTAFFMLPEVTDLLESLSPEA